MTSKSLSSRRIFDACLESDLVLSELETVDWAQRSESVAVDPGHLISIRENPDLKWNEQTGGDSDTHFLRMSKDVFAQYIEGIATFRVSHGRLIEWKRYDDSVSDRDIKTFLLDGAMAALFVQRGSLVFRGTTLHKNGQAVLLLADPVTGRSTLAYLLLRNGWSLLSNGMAMVDSDGMAYSGIHSVKLWRDVLRSLDIDLNDLPVVRRGLNRFLMMPPSIPVVSGVYPLKAVYSLFRNDQKHQSREIPAHRGSETPQESAPNPSSDDFRIFHVRNHHVALMTYRNSISFPRFYRGMGREAGMFSSIAKLSGQDMLYRLQVPNGIKDMISRVSDLDLISAKCSYQDLSRRVGSDSATEYLPESK